MPQWGVSCGMLQLALIGGDSIYYAIKAHQKKSIERTRNAKFRMSGFHIIWEKTKFVWCWYIGYDASRKLLSLKFCWYRRWLIKLGGYRCGYTIHCHLTVIFSATGFYTHLGSDFVWSIVAWKWFVFEGLFLNLGGNNICVCIPFTSKWTGLLILLFVLMFMAIFYFLLIFSCLVFLYVFFFFLNLFLFLWHGHRLLHFITFLFVYLICSRLDVVILRRV